MSSFDDGYNQAIRDVKKAVEKQKLGKKILELIEEELPNTCFEED
jgi:hypothetical protein